MFFFDRKLIHHLKLTTCCPPQVNKEIIFDLSFGKREKPNLCDEKKTNWIKLYRDLDWNADAYALLLYYFAYRACDVAAKFGTISTF